MVGCGISILSLPPALSLVACIGFDRCRAGCESLPFGFDRRFWPAKCSPHVDFDRGGMLLASSSGCLGVCQATGMAAFLVGIGGICVLGCCVELGPRIRQMNRHGLIALRGEMARFALLSWGYRSTCFRYPSHSSGRLPPIDGIRPLASYL